MHGDTYLSEAFSDEERAVLGRFFTNTDRPVYGLINLPEVVKGALYARYSRTHKSLRRLFLDEFAGPLNVDDASLELGAAVSRAEALYDRVLGEYGDDSVAQLGGAHVACEQASNLLTKILEWGRLMSYLEQSTRYIDYGSALVGSGSTRDRFHRPPQVLASPLGPRYLTDMDAAFDGYRAALAGFVKYYARRYPRQAGDSEGVWRASVRAKALDAARGLLPAASLSNVGVYGSGQGWEQLLIRMGASPLPEARAYAQMLLVELRRIIPSFVRRVDLPERGGVWSAYLHDTRTDTAAATAALLGGEAGGAAAHEAWAEQAEGDDEVALVRFDHRGEEAVLAAAAYPHAKVGYAELLEAVGGWDAVQRGRLMDAYVGERANRRHRPGRAFEESSYSFDVVGDYGAFRDLQRHRLCTIEWQRLSPRHGACLPEAVAEAGLDGLFEVALERSGALHDDLVGAGFVAESSYAVLFAHRVRFRMPMNAREAMHVLELRTTPQGHASYRRVAQCMHRLICEVHPLIGAAMGHVNHDGTELERLESERRAEARRGRSG